MYSELLEVLICPICKKGLHLEIDKEDEGEIISGYVLCNHNHRFKIHEGVVDFNSQEQDFANNWTEMYEEYEQDYETVDREIKNKTPEKLKEQHEQMTKAFIDYLNNYDLKYVLDVATGRGELMKQILKSTTNKHDFICTDLSFEVLKHDRIKFKKVNPLNRVNFIACDASNLPIKSCTMDLVTSFYGILNMMDKAVVGIKDAHRTLKDHGHLLNAVMYVEENSEATRLIEQVCKQYDISGLDLYTERMIRNAYRKAGTDHFTINVIAEGIGEKNELDLVPVEGEWYALSIVDSKK